MLAAAGLLVLMVALGGGGPGERTLESAAGPIRSIAVLPLVNLSRDPGEDYFADAMTDALIAELGKIEGLRVISRRSVMQFRGTREPIPEVARKIGVEALVEGSVTRENDRVRITAQLIQAAPERHLWAESYDEHLSDVLKLQGRVAQTIASEIRVKLTPGQQRRLSRAREVDPGVYLAYLRGRQHWYAWTEDDRRKALELFEKAIARDPSFAPAYAGIADCWMATGFEGRKPSHEAFRKARAAAEKAIGLDPELPEAYVSLGYIKLNYDWDWAGAEAAFQRALKLNPGHAEAHHARAYYLDVMGKPQEALAEMRRNWELDPLSAFAVCEVGRAYEWLGDYDEAIVWYRRSLELDPGNFTFYADLGLVYAAKGAHEQAIGAVAKGLELAKGDESYVNPAWLARVHALAGNKDRALRILRGWKTETPHACDIAAVHTALGDRDEAFRWLERAYEVHDSHLIFLHVDRWFAALKPDPRFEDLARRVGLPGFR